MNEYDLKEKMELMNSDDMRRALRRIAHEIVEKNSGIADVMIVGIRTRGVPIANIIAENITSIEGKRPLTGVLDITLYRDDLKELSRSPIVRETEIMGDINGKHVVLVDDVLYTGRTIRAALDALSDIGRPKTIQLAVLIDRGHRELPIRADYVGKNVPTASNEIVSVQLIETDGSEKVVIRERA